LFHDIGKMAIPLEVLNKPGKLTDAEFTLIKTHSERGHEMLLEAKNMNDVVLDVCLHHHERVDGTGYPQARRNDDISLFAKMSAVCDVYDATTSDRPYKKGWDPAESIHKMAEWSKTHFDNWVFQAFVKSIGIYPVGSLVRLNSRRLGIVVDQSEQSLLAPRVKVFFSLDTQTRLPPKVIDLANCGGNEKILTHENPAKWGFRDLEALWRGAESSPRPSNDAQPQKS